MKEKGEGGPSKVDGVCEGARDDAPSNHQIPNLSHPFHHANQTCHVACRLLQENCM